MKETGNGFSSRRRFSPKVRDRLLHRYHRSGLTQREFVGRHALSLATLSSWLRQERQRGSNPAWRQRGRPRFQSVDLSQMIGAPGWAAEVALPDGSTLRLSTHASTALVDGLLQTLRRPC